MLEVIWNVFLEVIYYLSDHLMIINGLFAIVIIFFQRKNPQNVWTWLLVLYFIPVIGFLFYLLLGTDMRKRKMFKMKEIEDKLNEVVKLQETQLKNKELQRLVPEIAEYSDLVMYNLDTMGSTLSDTNDMDIFVDGREMYDRLIKDLENAKEFIHIQYYIIKNDVLFNQIKEVLVKKAAQGVEVRILYDAMGCRFIRKKYWEKLRKQGIKTAEFFPAFMRWFHLRMNYRNHRKIVVIDNKIGYVGGFNIGKEYISLDPKFGYWRDTHMRIVGEAVSGLEIRFLLDWNYTAKENLFTNPKYMSGFESGVRDNCEVQIIYSGPDTSRPQIRDNYVSLINKAKKSIYIQTPYFIPDEAMLTALMIALHSGVEVNLMIPCKPDHMFVYWATYSYMGELVMNGANCYIYNDGFLHSKGIIVDGKAFCYGTANMDIRSFSLNFEVNAVVYDEMKALEMLGYFKDDLKRCSKISKDVYAARGMVIRAKEQVCRLFSPIL